MWSLHAASCGFEGNLKVVRVRFVCGQPSLKNPAISAAEWFGFVKRGLLEKGLFIRGRQVGDGMGGGWNGRFFSCFAKTLENKALFRKKKKKKPKHPVPTTAHPIPHLTPSYFQKSPFSRDSSEFGDSRVSSEHPDCGKQRRFWRFSRDSGDFRDSRDSSTAKTPFAMTPVFQSRMVQARSRPARALRFCECELRAWKRRLPPPLHKYYRQLFLFAELISLGLPEKSVTWLPEIISGELIPWDYRKVCPRVSTVWGDVNWWRTRITGNIGNVITGKIPGKLILNNYQKIR